MWLKDSSIGRKFVMALSGAALVFFLLFHGCMNLALVFSEEAYNAICRFLGANWYAVIGSLGIAFLVLVLAWINAFRIFKEVYVIAGSYPDQSVYTLQHYMNNMFSRLDYQMVTAAAYSFALIVMLIFGVLFLLQRRASRDMR